MADYSPSIPSMPSAAPPAWMSLLRSALIAGGGVLVTKGWIDQTTLTDAIGAILILGPAIWGVLQKVEANARLKAAIAAPAGKAS